VAPSAKLNPFERAISQVTQVETKSFVIPTFLGSTRTEGHRTANTESIDSRYEEEEEEEEKEEEAQQGREWRQQKLCCRAVKNLRGR